MISGGGSKQRSFRATMIRASGYSRISAVPKGQRQLKSQHTSLADHYKFNPLSCMPESGKDRRSENRRQLTRRWCRRRRFATSHH